MRDVLAELESWWASGEPVGVATVVGTWHSAPRPPGAVMLVGPDGSAVGSVSGGCVEGAVYDLAVEVIDTGSPQLTRFGVTDDESHAVGLTCGGTIDIFVERIDRASFPSLDAVAAAIRTGTPVAIATCIAGGLGRLIVFADRVDGTLGNVELDAAAVSDARGLLASGRNGTLRYGPSGERLGDSLTLFVASYAPRPRMLVFGAIDFAAAVASVGAFLGYHVTVCDARPIFATPRRFPDADEVVVEWPHRYLQREADAGRIDSQTVVCVLTHDPKFDGPLLESALRLPLAYVGAMGSRRTHSERLERLREAGLLEHDLARLSSPIGLDLGARTPEETAVSIAAEIVAARWGGTGQRLTGRPGRIHGISETSRSEGR